MGSFSSFKSASLFALVISWKLLFYLVFLILTRIKACEFELEAFFSFPDNQDKEESGYNVDVQESEEERANGESALE